MNIANEFLECLFKLKDMVMDKGTFFLKKKKNAIVFIQMCMTYIL